MGKLANQNAFEDGATAVVLSPIVCIHVAHCESVYVCVYIRVCVCLSVCVCLCSVDYSQVYPPPPAASMGQPGTSTSAAPPPPPAVYAGYQNTYQMPAAAATSSVSSSFSTTGYGAGVYGQTAYPSVYGVAQTSDTSGYTAPGQSSSYSTTTTTATQVGYNTSLCILPFPFSGLHFLRDFTWGTKKIALETFFWVEAYHKIF